EFKDIKVEKDGQVVFQSDFSGGKDGWKNVHGNWSVQDGALRQTSTDERCVITAGDSSWSNYALSCKARKIEGKEGFVIMFNVENDTTYSWWNLGGWGNVRHGFEDFGGAGHFGRDANGAIETGRWYDIQIEVKGSHVKGSIDGRVVREADYPTPKEMFA